MLVDISKNNIVIKDSSSILKPSQVSQLLYLGLAKSPLSFSYEISSDKNEALLLKLLKYFENEKLAFTLSSSCQELVSKLNQEINRFEKLKLLGKEYKESKLSTDSFTEFSSFIYKSIPRQLKDHQIKAAFHLYLLGNAANFSVPGSGKTAVILSVYEKLKSENKVNTLFIVGPPACFGPWKTEFQLTLGHVPDYKILAGGERDSRKLEYFNPSLIKSELYLTTYQTLLNDQNEIRKFFNQPNNNVFLVLDEAHYIKQIGGAWATAVLNLAGFVNYRCILTGTPLPRSYVDVFNLMDFLWPNNPPLDPESKRNIQIQEEKNNNIIPINIFKDKISPLFYRVRKSDLGLIPPIFHPPFVLTMNKYEKMVYEAIKTKLRNYSKGDYLRNIELVMRLCRGRIMRLRQCTSYLKLLETTIENYNETIIEGDSDLSRIIYDYDLLEKPSKLEYLLLLVQKFNQAKQKVIIWANFIGSLELIVKSLLEIGFNCKLIYGKTPIEQTSIKEEEDRGMIRDEFVDPKSGLDILVANPAACSESISLHKTCYHAVYYDLSYNCAQYLQSLDRIHRVGGSEIHQANYYFLQYENSIDQDILDNLKSKAKKMNDIIEEDYSIYSLDMFADNDDINAYDRVFSN